MTDRERYIQMRKEARRYKRKYLRYKHGVEKFITMSGVIAPKDSELVIDLLKNCIGQMEDDLK